MKAPELPDDLVELQLRVLSAERVYEQRIADLYSHPLMRRARLDGSLDRLSTDLRAAARTAACTAA
jgi:hypothetical protein